MRKTFRIQVAPEYPYTVRWLREEPIEARMPRLTGVDFYEEDTDTDHYLDTVETNLEFEVERSEDPRHKDAYEISFHGYFVVDLTEHQLEVLRENDYLVDYALNLVNPADDSYNEEDTEFVSNFSVKLELVG